jgi:hypothetical protein
MTVSVPESRPASHYWVEGRLLEVCTCKAICPCWVGEDPDGGTCDSSLAWRVDSGAVEGVDVSGLTLAISVHIPGNVLAGGWKAVVYVDDQASEQQRDALLTVFTGQLGGGIADFAALIGEVLAVESAPIAFEVVNGEGTFKIGDHVEARLRGFSGPTGITTLNDSVFSTIPGSAAFPGKSVFYRRAEKSRGLSDLDIAGYNSVQGAFRFEA